MKLRDLACGFRRQTVLIPWTEIYRLAAPQRTKTPTTRQEIAFAYDSAEGRRFFLTTKLQLAGASRLPARRVHPCSGKKALTPRNRSSVTSLVASTFAASRPALDLSRTSLGNAVTANRRTTSNFL